MYTTKTFRLMGIDPGSVKFGISLFEIDIDTMAIVSTNAWTVNSELLSYNSEWKQELHPGRTSRILAIQQYFFELFNFYDPLIITSEAPFINNRFPLAGIVLTEVMTNIRQALFRYDVWKPLYIVPPSSAKNAVGALGNAKKEMMQTKILGLVDLNYIGEIPIQLLDEHAIDALAVGYSKVKELQANFRNQTKI